MSSELAAMRQEMADLGARLAEVTQAVALLAAHIPAASPSASPIMAETLNHLDAPDGHTTSDVADDETPGTSTPTGPTSSTSRRTLLKWGGLGAAAALAAAGGTALTSPTTHAASGGNFILGQHNDARTMTSLTFDIGAGVFDTTGLDVDASPNTQITLGINSSASPGGMGIQGSAFGANGGMLPTGVSGVTDVGVGVIGQTSSGTGVHGSSESGTGVLASSNTGLDLWVAGTGRILQNLAGVVGAPTTGSFTVGEQIRDGQGDLYICITSGTPGAWRKVAAGIPGRSGAMNFLTNPIRLLDTRTSGGIVSGAFTAGSTHSLQVTGVSIGGISVPTGSIGVVGNVTVVNPTAGGDLRLFPGGATTPATSSINFASGQTIANGVTVGLNSSGQLSIKVDMPSGSHTHVLFDASAFIL